MRFRKLLHDWLLVKCEPLREKTRSGIILPLGGRIRVGTVLQTGPGRSRGAHGRIPLDVEKGEKICFFREHMEHQQGKALSHILYDMGEDLALIRVEDVLFAMTGDVVVEEVPR